MPSIPQSLLWIALVVLWLFVLVPMLTNRRDAVRRTSDVALATRVLNGGAAARLIKRRGPAAGHRHDPAWERDELAEEHPEFDELPPDARDHADSGGFAGDRGGSGRAARVGARPRAAVMVAVAERLDDRDYLDVEVVEENSGALPLGEAGAQPGRFDPPVEQPAEPLGDIAENEEDEDDMAADPMPKARAAKSQAAEPGAGEYEYIDDTSGLEIDGQPEPSATGRSASRERRLSTTSEAAVSARKYRFRKRVLMAMAALMTLGGVLSLVVSPTLWWACGAVAATTVLYLAYLRRQTRIEEQIRRRRRQRAARSARPAVREPAPRRAEADSAEVPTRLGRPGAVVLEIDDEDPVFDHLDEVPRSRRQYGRGRDLPRAAGQ